LEELGVTRLGEMLSEMGFLTELQPVFPSASGDRLALCIQHAKLVTL